jgi:membrane protease YdiL (CAAX protease family)
LLTAPLLVVALLCALSLSSPVFVPGIVTTSQPASHLLFGIVVGLAAGAFEELGWTGFAVPALRRRHGVLASGLIVGLIWGAWHGLVVWCFFRLAPSAQVHAVATTPAQPLVLPCSSVQ